MKIDESLREALTRACQSACAEAGTDLKGLSWLYQNTLRQKRSA